MVLQCMKKSLYETMEKKPQVGKKKKNSKHSTDDLEKLSVSQENSFSVICLKNNALQEGALGRKETCFHRTKNESCRTGGFS